MHSRAEGCNAPGIPARRRTQDADVASGLDDDLRVEHAVQAIDLDRVLELLAGGAGLDRALDVLVLNPESCQANGVLSPSNTIDLALPDTFQTTLSVSQTLIVSASPSSFSFLTFSTHSSFLTLNFRLWVLPGLSQATATPEASWTASRPSANAVVTRAMDMFSPLF